jgi:Tol biopolymer transport system component
VGDIAPIGFVRDAFYYLDYVTDNEAYTATVDFETGRMLVQPALVTQRFAGTNASPEWSPDGHRLLYISRRGEVGPGYNIPAIRDMTTGEERDLAPDLRFINMAGWSPDGQSIIAFGWGPRINGLFRIDAETSQTTMLVESGPEGRMVPRLCPDMKTLLYLYSPRQGQVAIGMRNLDTGEEKMVTPVNHGLCWSLSRDGRLLAFLGSDEATKEYVLKVMPLAGGEARELMKLKDPWRLTWIPDNRNLLLQRGEFPNISVYRVPIDGGKPLELDLKIRGMQQARVHPDRRQIAFWARNSKSEIWVMENFLPASKAAR